VAQDRRRRRKEQIKEINRSPGFLSDPAKRTKYDELERTGNKGSDFPATTGLGTYRGRRGRGISREGSRAAAAGGILNMSLEERVPVILLSKCLAAGQGGSGSAAKNGMRMRNWGAETLVATSKATSWSRGGG